MTIPAQIKSLQHPIIKHCVSLRKESSYRKENNSFLVMGKKEIEELPTSAHILNLFTGKNPERIPLCKRHYILSEELFKKITGLANPEDIVAEVQIPKLSPHKLSKVLVCEEIADPGNLGTLLRTALAFRFDAVYLLGPTVDPFNDKVVRAARGALFHLPLLSGSWEEFSSFIQKNALFVYQADLYGEVFSDLTSSPPFALILGNEAIGTSLRAKKLGKAITIPINPHTESLNVAVAGGILMHQLSRLCPDAKNI